MDRAPLVEGWGQDVRSTPREMICWTAAKEGQLDDGRRRGEQEVAALEQESVKIRVSVEREVRRKTSSYPTVHVYRHATDSLDIQTRHVNSQTDSS